MKCACGHKDSEHKTIIEPNNTRKAICTLCKCGQYREVISAPKKNV